MGLNGVTRSEGKLTDDPDKSDLLLLLHEKEEEIRRLQQRIRLLEKALFGPRNERIVDDSHQQGVFDELMAEVEQLSQKIAQGEEEIRRVSKTVKASSRRKPRNLLELVPEDLPREEILLDVPEEERVCLKTGEPMVRIGEERSPKLAYRPGHYFLKVFVRPKYAAPKNPSQGVLCRQMPDTAVPGSHFDESFAAAVAVDKCAFHLPLYRQEEKLHYLGIQVSRQSLSRVYINSARALSPLYELAKKEILRQGIIFTDDTCVDLLVPGKKKTVAGRMWVYIGGGKGPPYRVFEFTRDRSKSRPKLFLKGYKGYIHADAYKGYDDLFQQDGVHECACWMHIRRRFHQAEDAPVALRRSVLAAIRLIYMYERQVKNGSPEEILSIRQRKTGPLIDRLLQRTANALKNGEVLPGSAFAEAIGYLHNLGPAVKTFLEHPDLRPDNGTSERAIRPLCIGRRNWLFAGSQAGGDATGILLSLVQSCRAMDIDPFAYLTDVLRRINGHPVNRLQELLPAHWKPAEQPYA